jgi:hypothetical protein
MIASLNVANSVASNRISESHFEDNMPKQFSTPYSLPALGFAGVCTAILILAQPAWAQGRRGGDSDVRLNAPKLDDADRKHLQDLQSGKRAFEGRDKDFLEKVAQWFVYQLTYDEYQFKKLTDTSASGQHITMKTLVDDACKHILIPDPKKPWGPQQERYMQEFSKALIGAIKNVLEKHVPIAQVNAGIILARLGETGIEENADAMAEIIAKDQYEDYVKLYALTGLKNLFKANEGFKDEERLKKTIKALSEFLFRKPVFDPNKTPPEEVEAFRYVRREAVRALGQTRLPAIGKPKAPDYRPALDLLKFMRGDGVPLEPSLSEKVEAAIGLCQMQIKVGDNYKYQPEYAAHYVGRLVVDFATRYDEKRGETSGIDWKHCAHRLGQALATLKTDAAGKNRYVDELTSRCSSVLNSIHAGNRAEHLALNDWLNRPVEAKELFKGMPDSKAAPEPEAK